MREEVKKITYWCFPHDYHHPKLEDEWGKSAVEFAEKNRVWTAINFAPYTATCWEIDARLKTCGKAMGVYEWGSHVYICTRHINEKEIRRIFADFINTETLIEALYG